MSDNPKAPEGQVADAVKGNWVDTSAPAWTRPYLRLSRADRPVGTWLLFIPCIWGVLLASLYDGQFGLWDAWIIAASGAGAWLMRGAGCTWNDITDRKIDAQVARTKSRPLPSGQVTVIQALGWMGAQCLIALAILLSFGSFSVIVGASSLIFVAIYPFAKRFTWWPQLFLGLAFNWGALLGWAAHSDSLHPAAFGLYAAGILWTLFYDTIYAHQDSEDDALIGVKSTARLFGDNSPIWLRRFMIGCAAILGLLVLFTPLASLPKAIAALGVAGFTAHLMWQLRQLDTADTDVCLRLFRANRDSGLIICVFFAIAALL